MQQLPKVLKNRRGVAPLLAKFGMPSEVYTPVKIPLLAQALGPCCMLIGVLIIGSYVQYTQVLFGWWLWWQAAVVPLVGALWIMIGIWFILGPVLRQHVYVVVCPNGLIYIKGKAEGIPWETIRILWKNTQTPHAKSKEVLPYIGKIQCKNEAFFLLKQDIDAVERLVQRIEREVVRRVLPEAIALYNKGMLAPFGDIAVDQEGVHLKQKAAVLPWNNIEHIGINQQMVSIYKKGEYWDWATLAVARIPNVAVLKGLIMYALQEHAKEPLLRMIATYNAGSALHFGSITISRRGVDFGKNSLAWSEIGGIDIGEHEVMIKRPSSIWGESEWEVFPIRTIPDAQLLKGLVDYVLQDRPR